MRTKYIHRSLINQNADIMKDLGYLILNTRGVFRTQPNIYNEAFSTIKYF